MPVNVPLHIGLRYTRAKRRNQFISFVSAFSLVGMALGVMALIVVLSVMNGFDREMKERILSVIPHGFIDADPALDDWRPLADQVMQHPEVLGAAPYIEGFGLLNYGSGIQGIQIQGILPEAQESVAQVEAHMFLGTTDYLQPGKFGIVLGRILARQLGLALGDSVTITLPDIRITPAGVYPRVRRFTLVGVFEVRAQLDQRLALIHLDDARRLFRYRDDSVQGIQLQVEDIYRAAPVLNELATHLPERYRVRDWSQTQGSLFQAVKMEKVVIAVLLGIIIAVAAFNIVSSLVLMVADKRSDIAVLRTLGLSARKIMVVFVVQGSAVGVAGTLIGAVVGCVLAWFVGPIVAFMESLLNMQVFDPSVYFISHLPSELMWQDVALTCGVALLLSFLATLYPAYRAAKIEPAEALRYE